MGRTAIIVANVLAIGWGCGCRPNDDPPPTFNVSMDAGGRKVMPTRVPRRQANRAILGAAAGAEDVRPARPPASALPSSPDKAAQAAQVPTAGTHETTPKVSNVSPLPQMKTPLSPPPSESRRPAKPPRRRDETDEVYSGPTMLRNR